MNEIELLAFFRNFFNEVLDNNTILPYGDDAFYVQDNIIINADMLVESTDIISYLGYKCAGWKLVTMAISDIVAKGGLPKKFILSMGIPRNISFKILSDFLSGIRDALKYYNISLLGGDLNETKEIIADGIAIGFAPYGVIRRDKLHEGDILAVTGDFGYTTLGFLYFLEKKKLSLSKIALKNIKEKLCQPKVNIKYGEILVKSGSITASIDSSDGLARALFDLIRLNSNIGFLIENLPVDSIIKNVAEKNKLNIIELALYGGEEFEIIFTIDRDKFNAFKEYAKKHDFKFKTIGKVIKGNKVLIKQDNEVFQIREIGWIHFE
ncbi:MAG: thiamine-phosphate kinase [Candidatus Asgardarchaeia archaeon]